MKKLTDEQIREKCDRLKAAQDQLTPYLTFALMRQALHYDSNSSVQNILAQAVRLGMAVKVDFGNGEKRYRFI